MEAKLGFQIKSIKKGDCNMSGKNTKNKKDTKATTAVYNILSFQFAGQATAGEMVKEIKSSGALDGSVIIAQAVVEQDPKGKVHIHEPGMGGVGAAVGAVGGGLLALIGGPVGLLAWVVGGAVIGGVAGKYLGRPIAKGDLEDFGKTMTPDTSAFMLLLEDIETEQVIKSMAGYNANVVTLTVGDELSGEIASYVAGVATDDKGNVIAGESLVAADAQGNVAAASEVAAGKIATPETPASPPATTAKS
jgi:uncharacterized membrane protein